METVTLVEPEQAQVTEPRWSLPGRIAFRFCFIYFVLYCLGTQIINSVLQIPKVDVPDWTTLWPIRVIVFWVGAHVFGLKTQLVYSGSGSGDKQFDWVLLFCMLVSSVAATVVWSAMDRRRANYEMLDKWFRLFLVFCLAGQMFVYGMIKAVPLQMPYPFLSRLIEPFGQFSPMGVLWSSIGAAPGYETVVGCAELVGGVLLIFGRTRTLGALICLVDMLQVFLLNMTYDVPVKLLSFHLILISLLLLAPNAKRLINFFFLNRTAQPAPRVPLFAGRRAERIATGVVAFLWIWILGCNAYGIWNQYHKYGPVRQKSALYGIWNIQDYGLDGKQQPLAVTDAQAWRSMIFDFQDFAQVQLMEGSHPYQAAIDQKAGTLTLSDYRDKTWHAEFKYARPSFDHLTLEGTVAGKKALLHLQRVDEKKLPLESRGFHWVQDYPFNR